jgi:transcriptional regulator with XRE-family HTH domain
MIPYSCRCYKDVLKSVLELKKNERPDKRLSFQAMAIHCGIQKTYLSKVLNHDGHLSADQLFAALEYLGLEQDEIEFCILLMAREKSQSKKRREIISERLQQIRTANVKTDAHITVHSNDTSATDLLEYYLDPFYQIIHMCLTIRRFQLDPGRMTEVFRFSRNSLRKYMRGLQQMRIISYQESKGGYAKVEVLRDDLHLPQDSIMHDVYAARMRLKSLEQAERSEKSEAYRFSVIFSTDQQTRDAIHSSFLKWLKSVQMHVKQGVEEDVFQMNFDLLRWT